MKRRDLLKSFLAAPFVWLFKGKKVESSCSSSDGGGSSSPSISSDLYSRAKDCIDTEYSNVYIQMIYISGDTTNNDCEYFMYGFDRDGNKKLLDTCLINT